MHSHQERKELLKKAKNKDIVEVARQLDMELTRQGKTFLWKEHDSLVIETKKNFFYWNSQGFGGDPIKLVETIKGCSFKEAIAFLNGIEAVKKDVQKSGKNQAFHYYLKDQPLTSVREYLQKERGLSEQTISLFEQKGLVTQSMYKDPKTQLLEPVAVFKCFDRTEKTKAVVLRGITERLDHEEKYLKRTLGDGFSGMVLPVGNPPMEGAALNKENPLIVVAFEAPIDMLSYYELYHEKMGDALLVSMNGLRKGTVSKCIANQLKVDIAENEKPTFLDYLEKHTKTKNELIKIVLAVDNDEAGHKFVEDFGITMFPVITHYPKLPTEQRKVDWNDFLKMKKSTQMNVFQKRIKEGQKNRKNEITRINPIAKITR